MPSVISQQRVTRFIQSRFNPIRSLTPEWLAQMIDSFDAGFLREFALAAETIERRDDVLMTVAPKRKKAIGRHGYEIVPIDDSAQAKAHAETLTYFYDNLTATNAIKEDERGGFKLLVRQMADAIGKGYAVHEIIWKPEPDGLTAEFRFAPLWFFENRTGKLRYLPIEGAIDGLDLEKDGWLVTVGDGLMVACAIAYMFKSLPLKDWLIYCERFGMPIPIGETTAAKDSPEWAAMYDAVTSIMSGAAAVKNAGENITLLETKGTGEMPHSMLVERMDRAMTSLWRGSDLSTMSGKGSKANTGASVQGEESEILELDDTEWISETLGTQVSRFVIRYAHNDEKPLAYLKVLTTNRQDVQNDVLVDQFLLNSGFPLDASDVAERYGRPLQAGQEGLTLAPPAPVKDTNNPAQRQSASNEAAPRLLFNTAANEALSNAEAGGHWVTHNGRHIFIKDGDNRPIAEIMKEHGDDGDPIIQRETGGSWARDGIYDSKTHTAEQTSKLKSGDHIRLDGSDVAVRRVKTQRRTITVFGDDPRSLDQSEIKYRVTTVTGMAQTTGHEVTVTFSDEALVRAASKRKPPLGNEAHRLLFNTSDELSAFFESPEGSALLENALKKKERELVSDAALIPFIEARKLDLAPVAARISSFLGTTNEEQARLAIVDLKHSLPKFLKEANAHPRTAPVLAGVMAAEFFNGLGEAQDEREAA